MNNHEDRSIADGGLGAPAQRAARRVRRTTLSDVVSQEVRWLWPGYVPLGKITVLEGDPDLGKSTLTLALAAAVSTGSGMPDDEYSGRRIVSVV